MTKLGSGMRRVVGAAVGMAGALSMWFSVAQAYDLRLVFEHGAVVAADSTPIDIGCDTTIDFFSTLSNVSGSTPSVRKLVYAFPPQLEPVPGSCTATAGTCVVSSSAVQWDVTVPPGHQAESRFRAQVTPGTPPGATFCFQFTYTEDDETPVQTEICFRTGTNCVSVPTLTPWLVAGLALVLAAAGWHLMRRGHTT